MVGFVPNSTQVDAALWASVIAQINQSNIQIVASGEDDIYWCYCQRGRARLGLGVARCSYSDSDFYFWCGFKHTYFAFFSTRKLIGDIVAIVEASCADVAV